MAPHPPVQPVAVLCATEDRQGDNTIVETNSPDGGYGWVCVAACFTNNAVTWGAVSVSQFTSSWIFLLMS
jgi:hypothetical protein